MIRGLAFYVLKYRIQALIITDGIMQLEFISPFSKTLVWSIIHSKLPYHLSQKPLHLFKKRLHLSKTHQKELKSSTFVKTRTCKIVNYDFLKNQEHFIEKRRFLHLFSRKSSFFIVKVHVFNGFLVVIKRKFSQFFRF